MNGEQLHQKFDFEWGKFRKFIASNPLSGFFIGVGLGVGGTLLVNAIARAF